MEQEQIDKALKERWYWKHAGRYGLWYVDQYNGLEDSKGTYSSIGPNAAYKSRTTAGDTAKALNGAYKAGIERGQAEIIKWLLEHGEDRAAELIMNSGQFDD